MMKDRAGEAYGAIGGVLAGAGGSTLLAGLPGGAFPWQGLLGAAMALLVGLYLIFATVNDWWLPGRRSSLAHVVANAKNLSGEIMMWLGERGADEPHVSFDNWDESNRRSSQYSSVTRARWNERFAVRSLTAYDQLVAHGAEPHPRAGGRSYFEHAVNPLVMHDIGMNLGLMAAQLEATKMARL